MTKTKLVLEVYICDELMKYILQKRVGGPTLKTKHVLVWGVEIPSQDEIVAEGLVKIETSCVNNVISCTICIEVQNLLTSVIFNSETVEIFQAHFNLRCCIVSK